MTGNAGHDGVYIHASEVDVGGVRAQCHAFEIGVVGFDRVRIGVDCDDRFPSALHKSPA